MAKIKFLRVPKEAKVLLLGICLLLAWISIGRAEVLLMLDPQVTAQLGTQSNKLDRSKKSFMKKTAQVFPALEQKLSVFNKAGAEEKKAAADGVKEAYLDTAEALLDPLEQYSIELKKMHEMNARASASAKPANQSVRGSAKEVATYNQVVANISSFYDHVFVHFDSPELEQNKQASLAALKALQDEQLISRTSGKTGLTRASFSRLDTLLLNHRMMVDAFVNNLTSMTYAVMRSEQEGVTNKILGDLENLLGDIGGRLIPAFLSPAFGEALQVISSGGSTQDSGSAYSNSITFDSLYIE